MAIFINLFFNIKCYHLCGCGCRIKPPLFLSFLLSRGLKMSLTEGNAAVLHELLQNQRLWLDGCLQVWSPIQMNWNEATWLWNTLLLLLQYILLQSMKTLCTVKAALVHEKILKNTVKYSYNMKQVGEIFTWENFKKLIETSIQIVQILYFNIIVL